MSELPQPYGRVVCRHPAGAVIPQMRDGAPSGRGHCSLCGAAVLVRLGEGPLTEVTGR